MSLSKQVTMFEATDGTVHRTRHEAERHSLTAGMERVLEDLDIYWGDTSPEQVAKHLLHSGYTIVHIEPAHEAA